MFNNVMKKNLKREFGHEKYNQYARIIRQNIKRSPVDTTEIFNDLYFSLQEKDTQALKQIQERMNHALMEAFQINHSYIKVFIAYLTAFVIIASCAIQMVAVPGLLLISLLFLGKTWIYLENKFCYVDAHMILVLKAVLEQITREKNREKIINKI